MLTTEEHVSRVSFQMLPSNLATASGPNIAEEPVGDGGSGSEQGQGCV